MANYTEIPVLFKADSVMLRVSAQKSDKMRVSRMGLDKIVDRRATPSTRSA
jgi:hypothetical protein